MKRKMLVILSVLVMALPSALTLATPAEAAVAECAVEDSDTGYTTNESTAEVEIGCEVLGVTVLELDVNFTYDASLCEEAPVVDFDSTLLEPVDLDISATCLVSPGYDGGAEVEVTASSLGQSVTTSDSVDIATGETTAVDAAAEVTFEDLSETLPGDLSGLGVDISVL